VIRNTTHVIAQYAVDAGGKKLRHCLADRVAWAVHEGAFRLHPTRRDLPCGDAQELLGVRVRRGFGGPAEEVEKNGRDRLVDPLIRADCRTELSHHRHVAVVKAGYHVVIPGGDQL
jgi:hypothetical protein